MCKGRCTRKKMDKSITRLPQARARVGGTVRGEKGKPLPLVLIFRLTGGREERDAALCPRVAFSPCDISAFKKAASSALLNFSDRSPACRSSFAMKSSEQREAKPCHVLSRTGTDTTTVQTEAERVLEGTAFRKNHKRFCAHVAKPVPVLGGWGGETNVC